MKCTECDEETGTTEDICENCCDHSDADFHSCLICGHDMVEDRMCAAYDRAKAARQDGD